MHNFSDFFGPLRLFEYITFRAGGAFFTAFLLTIVAIPPLLPFFRKHCIQKSARTDDGEKPHKPLMGGVVIIASVLISSLLWGIFIAELASSFIQRFVYRHFGGKRFFLMAPIHHHYEKQGIPDSKIIVRFWITAILCALIGLGMLKLR